VCSSDLNLLVVVLIAAFLLFIFFIYKLMIKKIQIVGTITIAFIFLVVLIGLVWGYGLQNPLYFERIVLGTAHADTIFHISIASMIKMHWVASTGLDGVAYIPYHWGSHFIFAQLSKLSQVDVLTFYNLGYPVIFVPLLFATILNFVLSLRVKLDKNPHFSGYFWLILLVAFTGVLPLAFAHSLNLQTNAIFASESYLVSVSMVFILFAIIVHYINFGNFQHQKNDIYFLWFVLPFMLGIIGLTKVSLIFLLLVIYIFLFLRLKLFIKFEYWISMVLSAAVFFIIYKLTDYSYGSGYSLFNFVRTYVAPGWYFFFLLLMYSWSWIYLILRLRALNIRNLQDLFTAINARQLLDLEIIFVMSLVGFIPGAIYAIVGGSAYYFMELPKWISLAMLLTVFVGPPKNLTFLTWRSVKVNSVLLVIFSIPFVLAIVANLKIIVLDGFIRDNINVRTKFISKYDIGFKGFYADILKIDNEKHNIFQAVDASMSNTQLALSSDNSYTFFKQLRSLSNLPQSEKSRTLLFIPQGNYLYWDHMSYNSVHSIGPALSELAMIEGIQPYAPRYISPARLDYITVQFYPNASQIKTIKSSYSSAPDTKIGDGIETYYSLRENLSDQEKIQIYNLFAPFYYENLGYQSYGMYSFPTEQQYLQDTTDFGLCQKAKSKGFDKIIVLDEKGQNIVRRDLDCRI
jgi:hypothetical protein